MKPNAIGVIALAVVGLFLAALLAGFVIGKMAFRSSLSSPAATRPGGAMSTSPATPQGASPTPPDAADTEQVPLGGSQGASSGQHVAPVSPGPVSPTMLPGVLPPAPLPPPAPSGPAAPSAAPSPSPAVPGGPPPTQVPPPYAVTPATGAGGNSAFSPTPNRFHVQVGAFDDRQNAEALRLRFRSMGYAVTVTDGPPFRVWVGAYLDRSTAQRLVEHLRAAGFEAVLSP